MRYPSLPTSASREVEHGHDVPHGLRSLRVARQLLVPLSCSNRVLSKCSYLLKLLLHSLHVHGLGDSVKSGREAQESGKHMEIGLPPPETVDVEDVFGDRHLQWRSLHLLKCLLISLQQLLDVAS